MKQQDYEVYQYIASYIKQHGYSPLLGEIADALGIEVDRIQTCLQNLWNEGYLCYPMQITGTIYLTSKALDLAEIVEQNELDANSVQKAMPRTKIYHYVSEYIQTQQRSPALSEIAKAVGLGTTTVKHHIDVLRQQGYLKRTAGKNRSLQLTGQALAS